MGDAKKQRQPVTQKNLEQLLKFREELIKETNGQVFEDSARLIRRERIKRTRHLMEAAIGKPFKLNAEDLADFDEDDLKDLAEDEM
jgi:hypothetical protein